MIQEPQHVEHAAEAAAEKFNAGKVIIEHVSNGEHPIIHLPKLMGIDFSVTKHVFMLWFVAVIVFVVVTWTIRRYLKQETTGSEPSTSVGLALALAAAVAVTIVLGVYPELLFQVAAASARTLVFR